MFLFLFDIFMLSSLTCVIKNTILCFCKIKNTLENITGNQKKFIYWWIFIFELYQ